MSISIKKTHNFDTYLEFAIDLSLDDKFIRSRVPLDDMDAEVELIRKLTSEKMERQCKGLVFRHIDILRDRLNSVWETPEKASVRLFKNERKAPLKEQEWVMAVYMATATWQR